MEPERPPLRNLPRTIGRYEVTGRIGKGAMGVVYSARDSMMERTVAVKVMMTDLEDDPDTSARFYREARSAGQVVHPNIVTIFDMGEDNGHPFIVMELFDGETLNKYLLRPEAAGIETKLDLMIQICEGLRAAHAHGIFHRDIKPGNLLVRPDGELKIVDFGIARLASSSMTASGLIVGTPDYMSPEQARGDNADERSDIFSAGAVFYFILTGRKPFAASGLTAVLAKVQREDPLPVREGEAPPMLAQIVSRALAKNPEDRYQTCAQMIAELGHFQRHLADEARKWVAEGAQRLRGLEAIVTEYRTLASALRVAPASPDLDAAWQRLLERYAALDDPCRRESASAFLAEVKTAEESATSQIARWRQAWEALDQGKRALAANRPAEAVAKLEAALEIEPGAHAASQELDRCRARTAHTRADSDRVHALIDEARKAAASKRWQVAIELCDEAIALDAESSDAASVRRKAADAMASESQHAKGEFDSALEHADELRKKKKFTEAAAEIARARAIDPAGAGIDAGEIRLRESMAEADRQSAANHEAAGAIAAARAAFSEGRRTEAITGLRTFAARVREPICDTEIERLEAEARRIVADEERLAGAAADATAGETALASGAARAALHLATRALSADPGQRVAQKVSGLAGAQLKQQAEIETRSEAARQHIADARQQLARGQFAKARALVSAAAALDPDNPDHKAVLGDIHEAAKRTAEASERERLAKQRAKAVAPMVARARGAEAAGDYERALWTAQNALAVDPDCDEAGQILTRVEAQLAANPRLSEETVDLGGAADRDPDDTVSLTRPLGLWERVVGALRFKT
ncbi:MAG: protein kinase domain-containing protein [Vicinamibacterales bacterium]